MGSFAIEEQDCDAAYESQVQRELDAYTAGRRTGALGLGAGLGADYDGRELTEWHKGYAVGIAERTARELRDRPRKACDTCTCGGRGLCLDHG